MADKFVWSGATGANDGSSWADAYTSLMRDWGVEGTFTPATDYVYVRSVHSESSASALTVTGTTGESAESPVRILSVVGDTTGTDPGALAAGATVTNTGTVTLTVAERIYVYGVTFKSNQNIVIGASAGDVDIALEALTLQLTDAAAAAREIQIGIPATVGNWIEFTDVTITFANAGQGFTLNQGVFRWRGGSVTTNQTTLFEFVASRTMQLWIEAVDLSAVQGAIFSGTAFNIEATLRLSRCALHASATLVSGTIDVPGADIQTFHCQVGTDSDPAYQMQLDTSRGRVSADTSRYRSGGASDGVRTNPISWDLNTSLHSVRGYPGHALVSLPIVGWTPGNGSTAHTYRIYFASDATINDDELWFDLIGPNDAATNSLGARKTTRVAPRTTAAAYTTDGVSSWTGTGVGTKQYMEITYTPDKPGPISAQVYLAKASDNVYIDPKIYVDP